MILCLDKSGSMSGRPFTALKSGSIMVGQSIFGTKEFEHVSICLYDDKARAVEPKTV